MAVRVALFFSLFALSVPAAPRTRNVAIVLYEGVELLDFAGPGEVFAAAAHLGSMASGTQAFNVYTVGRSKTPLLSEGFVRISPEFSIEDAPRPDIVVFPGGGVQAIVGDPAFMAWARKSVESAEIAVSVCNGAFVLGNIGALDGKTVTTHWGSLSRLRSSFPRTTVQEGRRFVDNGKIITTAGVSAGIDGALHVVARLLGRAAADETARYMEYRWTPEPYLSASYASSK